MVQALLTRKGKEKEAASMAGGQPLVIAHMAFGDGDYAATGGETALRNEVERKPIHAQGVVDGKANVSFFKARL
ncbi:MAG: phage tail protein, partial [Cohaesibacter sp.]|nr:phage tail protein [Cohaesibacter sp.]